MPEEIVPIGPGPESVGVLLWAAGADTARWDRSTWDGGRWGAAAWRAVGCDVGEVQLTWGASSEAGILSVADAGELDAMTIDPERELDPLNAASPYYGSVRPGTPIRLVGYAPDEIAVATAYVDEVSFDLASSRGRIRALDGISYLAQSQLPAGVVLPDTLRARVRAVVEAVGLGGVVPVEPEARILNQLVNGSFEDGAGDLLAGAGSFEDGSLAAWGGPSARNSSVGYGGAPDGGRVLRILGDGAANYPSCTTSAIIPVRGGAWLSLVASAAMAQGAGVGARVRIDAYKAGVATGAQYSISFPAGAVNAWATRRNDAIALAADADGIRVWCYIDGPAVAASVGWFFDAVTVRDRTPVGWGASGVVSPSGCIPFDGAVDGDRVARIVGGAGYPKLIRGFPAEPGGTYTLVGYTRRDTGAGLAGTIGIGLRNASGGGVGGPGSNYVTASGADATAWERIEIIYTVPTDGSVASIEADCRLNASATVAADQPIFDAVTLTGPVVGTTLEPDPPVAPYDASQARPAWQVITDAAQDALTFVWVDPLGELRFRSFGGLIDAPINVGCPPADADAGEMWLEGLSTLRSTAAGAGVRNSVRAYSSALEREAPELGRPDAGAPKPIEPAAPKPIEPAGPDPEPRAEPRAATWAPAVTDPVSVAKYGPRPFDVPRVVPGFSTFASRVLADRSDAGLEVGVGELRPYDELELAALLETGLGGPATIRARDDAHGEPVDLDLAMIGASIGVSPAGWRFGLVTFLSRVAWDAITPPPEPVTPPAGAWHTETRSYVATSDALLALTSGGSKYGAGASSSLPVGAWSGWTYRALLGFPAIPWAKIRAVRTATLKMQTSDQVRVGFGSTPKAQLLRITSGWSAGSASTPSSGNAVVWPGPATTSSGAVTAALPKGENAAAAIRCDAIVRAWAPASAGGSGAPQYGIELREASSSTSNTGEVWPVERGGSARPTLELVLEVFD